MQFIFSSLYEHFEVVHMIKQVMEYDMAVCVQSMPRDDLC
jgi:hypothetical protein